MRDLVRTVRAARLPAVTVSIALATATTAVAGGGNTGTPPGQAMKQPQSAPASPPGATPPPASVPPAAGKVPPGQAKKPGPAPAAGPTPPATGKTPPGAAKKTPAEHSKKPSPAPATPVATGTPGTIDAPTPVPAATAPVVGESMGVKPVAGTVQVRLPQSSGYVSLAAAGSIPSGAVVDARAGTIVLRTAVDGQGHTQSVTIRGARFEVRQSPTGGGMTDLVLRAGRPKSCPSASGAAGARAAMVPTKSKGGPSSGLWARDRHGRFRTRGINSVATVRGTRWVTRETCAGTLTRVLDGAVDVFDRHTHRTVRVRAGHSYLARASG